MFDVHAKWPFGLHKFTTAAVLRFAGFSLLVLLSLVAIDGWVTQTVAALPDALRAPFFIITRAGKSDWILIPTLAGVILGLAVGKVSNTELLKTNARTCASVSAFIFSSVAAAGLVAWLIKRLVGRARPVNFEQFGILHFEPINADWAFHSFPSGDTTTIFALALALMFLIPRFTMWLLGGALLVGLSRVMVGMHFPSDVFVGFLTGTLGAYAVRNFCANRNWLFKETATGQIVLSLNWLRN